ncbi:MAG TPA: serine/threonine protein kinase [Gemmatimonadales bacterium]|nr:serine/threonine protein kinase [Gemmatimonadales bacterium]
MTRERLRALLLSVLPLALVALVGWWANREVARVMRERAADRVQNVLRGAEAAVTAVTEQQQSLVRWVASEPRVREALLSVAARSGEPAASLRRAPERARLEAILAPILGSHGIENFAFVDTTGRILASNDSSLIGQRSTRYSADRVARMRAGEAVTVPPFGVDTGGATLRPAILTAIGVHVDDAGRGPMLGWFDMRADPSADYDALFAAGRLGTTGEVLLFDSAGTLLSASRFEDDLRRVGLLLRDGDEASALNVRLADPGGDMLAGFHPGGAPRGWPLTAAVAKAVAGDSGTDVDGYRNYLGRTVVGAWRWYPKPGIGLVAEQDHAEAYAPLMLLRRAFGALLALLAIGAVLITTGFRMLRHSEARAQRAERLGQYTLERKIGEGAMGAVYRARHALLRRPTAVKLLRPDRFSQRAKGRFEREVQITSRLTHPNTVAVYDYGRTDAGTLYYAMEFLRGLTLDAVVNRFGPMPERRVVHVLKQVAGSLAEAHDQGLVHRDVKPQNVMLCHRGGVADLVKVIDFGLVKDSPDARDPDLTSEGAAVGTPLYMAPEAASSSGEVDARSDLYSVGVVAYFLVTGEQPFFGLTAREVFRKHLEDRPESPSAKLGREVAPELESLILRCLAKSPEARPESARALLCMLEEVVEPALGAWSNEEAEAWWRAHAPELIGPGAESDAETEGRLAVDLAGRGGS